MERLVELLNEYESKYNRRAFIKDDPICVPHRFNKKQDIEIAGFIAAIFAWGLRKTIINKSSDFLSRMGESPHEFILNHSPEERLVFSDFVHRTFQPVDAYTFVEFLQNHYRKYDSLEMAFTQHLSPGDESVKDALSQFHLYFLNTSGAMKRTMKHVATPDRKSTCKRLNMFLRWMVRKDDRGVDFGLWKDISPSQLCIPLDVHVERVARNLHLLKRKSIDWQSVMEIMDELKRIDSRDPVKYDFALFGMSLEGRF